MQAYRVSNSILSQQYMFTVSNLSHDLVTPEQYTQLVSTISQYHLIPGFMSDYIDDPWDIVIQLLPYSKNTIIDVTLPYISYLKYDDGNKKNETKILGRYILYKEQVIGIKLSTSNNIASHKASSNSKQKFKSRLQPIPQKVQTYYVQNNIQNFQQSITVGDFYLITNKFKIALLFQSQITQGSVINPYIMMGCQIVSIVNDQELNYEQFVNNYASQTYRKTVLEGINSVIIDVRKICFRSNLLLLYGGCKTCPSLGKVFYSRSFIQYANDINSESNQRKIDSEDVQFYPLVDLSRQKDFISEPQFNSNRLNICKQFNLSKNRVMRHAVINDEYSMHNQCQLQSLQMDSRIFDIRPLTAASKLKLSQFNQIKSIYQRQKLFISSQLNGKSLIRCMYVFNMINLFILSKQTAHKSPFIIGVPFTLKTKNLFDVIVYIFDNIKNYQANAADLEQTTNLTDILQLYRFQDNKNINHDFSTEELMLKQITGKQSIQIPTISELIKTYSKQKTIYLCSEDQQQKKKLKNICKQSGVEINFVDVIMVDQFSVPLQIKPTYDSVLNVEGYQNVLDSYVLKLRQMLTAQQIQSLRIKQNKKQQFPLRYIRLCQQLSRKNFLSIQQALKWIILQKQFTFEGDNIQLFPELIINELGKKVKTNIKILSQINIFFIKNSQSQILRKVTQMCLQIMRTKRNAAFNSMNSIPSDANFIIVSDSDQRQKQNHQSNQKQDKMSQKKSVFQKQQRQRSPQQLYLSRLQKCKKIKKQKQRKIILKCHRCQTQMLKNMLEKCKQCNEMVCLVCIEQLSGISGIKAGKQLSKFCTVCNRTCECDKCKRKRGRMLNESNKVNKQGQIFSQEIKKFLMVEQQPMKDKQISKNSSSIAGVSDFLFKTFSDSHQFTKLDIKICQKCQILNIGQKRYITIECIDCGKHECYFCVQQRYKQTNYKPQTLKTFYKNWKCYICDNQWQRFLENKKAQEIFEREKLMRQQQIKYLIINQVFDNNNMDVEVNSNHTSHYAGQNLMQNAYFLEEVPKRIDPRLNLNLYYNRSYSQSEVDRAAINQNCMRNNFIENNSKNNMFQEPSAPFFKSTQSLQSKSSSIKDDTQIMIPSVYPLPTINLASFNSQFEKQKQKTSIKEKQKKQCDTKGRNNSSDQGYDSKQDKKKVKNSSKIQISFRDKQSYKKQKNTGGPLWGNKSKQNKRSSSKSSSSESKYSKSKKFSSDQESIKSKNESQISFNPKAIEKKKSSVQVQQSNARGSVKNKVQQRRIRQDKGRDNERQNSKKKKDNKQKKQRKSNNKKSKRSNSYESGQVQLSSNSSSSSSSSSKSSKSSRSRKDRSKLKIKISSSGNRSRSKDRNRHSSRSNSSSVRKNDCIDRRSDSNRREQYRGRGRGGWNTNYHDRDSTNRGYSRGDNNWRGNNDRFNNRGSYGNRGGRDYTNNDNRQREGGYVSTSSAHYSTGYRSHNNQGYNNNRYNNNSGYSRSDNNRDDDRLGGNGYDKKDRDEYRQSSNNNKSQGGLLFTGNRGNNNNVSQDIQY